MGSTFGAFSGFEHHALYAGERTFVDSDSGHLSYAEAASLIIRLINGFAALGLGPEDRVAVISRNRPEILLLILAAMRGGPVVVPVNHRLAPAEIGWVLEDCDCRAIIIEAEFVDALADQIPQCIDATARFVLDDEHHGWRAWAPWLAQQGNERPWVQAASEPKAYLQVYTSGTTGRPKGVVLTDHNCLGQQLGILAASDLTIQSGERVLQALPLFHVGGIFVSLWAIFRGASLSLRREFLPMHAEDLMADGGIAIAVMVPAMIKACLTASAGRQRSFDGLRGVVYGASPITAETLRAAVERYDCDFLQIYGMTETHSVITFLSPQDHSRALLPGGDKLLISAGRPVAGTQLRIVNEEGADVLPGQVGEIHVKAPQVMSGYWRCDDATAEVMCDGHLRTGDAGYVDAEGYLFIVDRLKDIIVSGGENVASTEVESVLMQHPQVADVAVIGVPDERWGEAVKAVIVPKGAAFDEQDIINHCRALLGGFKVPRSISVIDTIPRNGAGKVLKAQLREPYWRGIARRVS